MTILLYATFFIAGTFVGALAIALCVMGRDDDREEPPPGYPRIWNGENK